MPLDSVFFCVVEIFFAFVHMYSILLHSQNLLGSQGGSKLRAACQAVPYMAGEAESRRLLCFLATGGLQFSYQFK